MGNSCVLALLLLLPFPLIRESPVNEKRDLKTTTTNKQRVTRNVIRIYIFMLERRDAALCRLSLQNRKKKKGWKRPNKAAAEAEAASFSYHDRQADAEATANIVPVRSLAPLSHPFSLICRPATDAQRHSPHGAVRPGAHRRQVLIALRHLPHCFVELLPIKSGSGRHGRRADLAGQ